ncbi:HK97 gp10 family phage protein [Neptuniibacter sp.]|uniref:HK97 gp10 family phage protein n=1 Tax=Neptuniibacter sp. TaxID=1962643 RepID=UPI0026290B6C|nr:HK97 gp10 family phage protein [Neptuniibacter sp.]MCP4595757.1 hypothetical protein [Neptuniibacter sp.]
MTSIKLEYDEADVLARLENLESELKVKAVRSGLTRVAAPLKKTAKRLMPVDEGDLAKAVGHKTVTKRQQARLNVFEGSSNRISVDNPGIAIIVGANRKVNGLNQSYKATLVEFGVKRKWRTYKKRRLRKYPGYHFGGIKGKYVMSRALSQTSPQIGTLYYQGVARYLNRIDA